MLPVWRAPANSETCDFSENHVLAKFVYLLRSVNLVRPLLARDVRLAISELVDARVHVRKLK